MAQETFNTIISRYYPQRTLETDVLIIGAGGAGMRAAIEAGKGNVKVAIVDKGRVGKSGATPTTGVRVFRYKDFKIPTKEKAEEYFKEVLQTGCYLADQDLLGKMIAEYPELIVEMVGWSTKPMDSYCDALNNEMIKYQNVVSYDYVMITKLLTENGRMAGATGLDFVTGELVLFKAKAVILATGGYAELYDHSEGVPLDVRTRLTGDGTVMAYHAGAELCEMEMVNFQQLPGSPKWMAQVRFVMSFLPGGGIRGLCCCGPYYDKDGKQVVSREEVVNLPVGCGPPKAFMYNPNLQRLLRYKTREHGTLYMNAVEEAEREGLDISTIKFSPWDHALGFPDVWNEWKADLSRIKLTIGMLIGQGGPKVNLKGETNVPGLYGAGEGAGSGNLYGACRPVSFMTTILPSGRTAGLNAAEYSKTAEQGAIDRDEVAEEGGRIYRFLEVKKDPITPQEVKAKITDIVMEHLEILRNGKGLQEAIAAIEAIRREDLPRVQAVDIKIYNNEWVDALEIPYMLDTAEMIARSSLFRTETRGTQNREDYPEMDNVNWLCHTLLRKEDGRIKLSKGPVVMTKYNPPSLEECLKGADPIPL
ncbi:MAG: FAD-binding protein [Deltaproteobacteria bacterium]